MPGNPDRSNIAQSACAGAPASARTYESGNWYGVLVPVKTPKQIIATIRDAALAALNNPAISKRLAELGYVSEVDNAPVTSATKLTREAV